MIVVLPAVKEAGPALWQAIMFIAMIPTVMLMFSNWGFKGNNIYKILGGYALFGILLMVWIVRSKL